jgi:hypothetical protein
MIPLCVKCRDKKTKPLEAGGSILTGCEGLSAEKWEAGWRDDGDGHYQHNCPLLPVEDEPSRV